MPDTQITHTIGRRKEAVCRVYLKPGSGKWDINGRTLGDYFPRPALVTAIQQPFTATDKLGQYDVKANVHGGGQTGQAGSDDDHVVDSAVGDSVTGVHGAKL